MKIKEVTVIVNLRSKYQLDKADSLTMHEKTLKSLIIN
jgi:hypothetical protein